MYYNTLKVEKIKDEQILRISLNRPEKRNAFNAELISELHDIFAPKNFQEKGEHADIRLIQLQGEGKAFCGGGDLNWMKSGLDMSEQENFEDCKNLTRMFLNMDQCPKPILGIIHGFAIGGGVGLVSVCDHVIAAQSCIFSLSEVKLGLVPACIGPFVLGKIGYSNARSLFVSGDRFGSERAKEIGLVHDVVLDTNLQPKVEKVSAQIIEGGPFAIGVAKSLLANLYHKQTKNSITESLDFAAGELARLRVGAEGQEGIRAFLEKRQPNWRAK